MSSRPSPVNIDAYDDIEAAYEPLSPCSSTYSGDLAQANWGSIAFEDLLYTDNALQTIIKEFRAAVIFAIKSKDFDEAHTKAEEQAKFLRDYIRRCMGAEHVCCDSEDYEQAQKIAKAIKYAVHLKKVTSERGGIAFGAVRRIQELLVKYRKHVENTRLEMKEAGEARNYTKAIALQHEQETCKNDYALKLCAHVDRVLESGNLRALEVACKAIQDNQPELQPDIMNMDECASPGAEQPQASSGALEGPAMIAAPPGTARRPHSARSAREEPPEKHRFDGTKKLAVQATEEMAKRLAVPKKTMEEKATNDDERQKGVFMLQEEFENCTFRPTIGVKGVHQPDIAKPKGTFWPTDRYPRRSRSAHGKARFEFNINMDKDGSWQLRRCIRFAVAQMNPTIQNESKQMLDRVDLEGCVQLIGLGLEDDAQITDWGLTEGEVVVLKKLKGQAKLFQLVDDLRAKHFLARAELEVKNARSQYLGGQDELREQAEKQRLRIQKVSRINPKSYTNLVRGADTPGRSKRKKALLDLTPSTPRMDIGECRAVVSQQLQFPDNDQLLDNIVALVEDEERCKSFLKCDAKVTKKLRACAGEALLRYTASLCKRMKFVMRMDSYNYKTKA